MKLPLKICKSSSRSKVRFKLRQQQQKARNIIGSGLLYHVISQPKTLKYWKNIFYRLLSTLYIKYLVTYLINFTV